MSIIAGTAIESALGGYKIERSLRFNSADSAYLIRTNSTSPTSDKICTWSFWFKNTQQTANAWIVGTGTSGTSTTEDLISVISSNQSLYCELAGGTKGSFQTSQVFRDPSAWYHIVITFDTTQTTSTNRIKLYVNGVQVTAFASISYPSQNATLNFGGTQPQSIGRRQYSPGNYLNGYLTEINFIDGSALDPTSFGEYNSDTGVWQPKAYSGSYGTNGFYLDFADNSSTTALGYDAAGSNDWTPNNFSVTAGAGNDSLVDTPTNYGTDTGVGGEVRGNYATLNPLEGVNSAGSLLGTFSNGNLDYYVGASSGNAPRMLAFSTLHLPSSGEWYCEFSNISNRGVGVIQGSVNQVGTPLQNYIIVYSGSVGANNGSVVSGSAFSFSSTDIIGVAYSADAGTITFYKNGVQQLVYGSVTTTIDWCFGSAQASSASAGTFTANFGARPFAYTAPTGFKALCTQNLPEPTVVDGGDYFNTVLYTGNATAGHAITGVGFQPDLVWIKSRSNVTNHKLLDSVRGDGWALSSDLTNADSATSNFSFLSNGFSLPTGTNFNGSGYTYVAWNWKANGTGVSNTAGTITSTVSANTTAGFSIVTYTGNGTNGATIGHGLGVAPSLIFIKNRGAVASWLVYSASIGASNFLVLNTTDASTASALPFNNTAPTSSVFSLGTSGGTNTNGGTFVAYCFAPVEGYSAFGSYVGNGSADGPFVYTGHRPRWIMVKSSSAAVSGWVIYDTVRSTYNVVTQRLFANSSAAQDTGLQFDILSNGFKVREAGGQGNDSGVTYIYAAFAENPFKYALAR